MLIHETQLTDGIGFRLGDLYAERDKNAGTGTLSAGVVNIGLKLKSPRLRFDYDELQADRCCPP